jgi:hypothetical protein
MVADLSSLTDTRLVVPVDVIAVVSERCRASDRTNRSAPLAGVVSIGFLARHAVVSVVSCLEACDGARDAAPRADSAAARAGQHVMAAAIVPAQRSAWMAL